MRTSFGMGMVERLGGVVELAVELAQAVEHLHLRRLTAIIAEQSRDRGIGGDAEDARDDHDHHQRIGQRVNVPAELEAGVQGADHDEAEAQIDMRRRPGLERPAPGCHRALADAEQRQPDDQPRADRTERIAVDAAAIGARLGVVEGVDSGSQRPRRRGRS
jgi:hypothetical protein